MKNIVIAISGDEELRNKVAIAEVIRKVLEYSCELDVERLDQAPEDGTIMDMPSEELCKKIRPSNIKPIVKIREV